MRDRELEPAEALRAEQEAEQEAEHGVEMEVGDLEVHSEPEAETEIEAAPARDAAPGIEAAPARDAAPEIEPAVEAAALEADVLETTGEAPTDIDLEDAAEPDDLAREPELAIALSPRQILGGFALLAALVVWLLRRRKR